MAGTGRELVPDAGDGGLLMVGVGSELGGGVAVPVEVRDCLGMVESELGEGIPVDGLGISDQGLPPGGWVARRQGRVVRSELVELGGKPGSLVAADAVVTEAGGVEGGLDAGDPGGGLLFGDDDLAGSALRRPHGSERSRRWDGEPVGKMVGNYVAAPVGNHELGRRGRRS